MSEAVQVFVAGIGGVFLGMACLYLSIRMVSLVIGRMERSGAEE